MSDARDGLSSSLPRERYGLFLRDLFSRPEMIDSWESSRARFGRLSKFRTGRVSPEFLNSAGIPDRGLKTMLSSIEKALFLKTVKLFESMSPEQIKILTNISEEITFQGGDILFNEGEPAEYLYVTVAGEIDIVKNHGAPGEIRLAVLGEKASFGEMALFGSEGRSATAIASGDSTFLAMRKEHLLLLIQENPAISTAIVFQLANMIRENNRQQS
jgi:CRP/FNR family cyclic AMP-dependent transcriptional regulator